MSARKLALRQTETSAELHSLTAQRSAPWLPFLPGATNATKWHQFVADKYDSYGEQIRTCETPKACDEILNQLDVFAANVAECGGRGLYGNPELM